MNTLYYNNTKKALIKSTFFIFAVILKHEWHYLIFRKIFRVAEFHINRAKSNRLA